MKKKEAILLDRDSASAYQYAKDIIKKRFPEAEEFIKTDAQYAYLYAKDVIKGPWPEAEKYIKQDAGYAYRYARDITKNRWIEAEEYIKKSFVFWKPYLSLMCKKCNGEGSIDLGIGGAVEECPDCKGSAFDPNKLIDEDDDD